MWWLQVHSSNSYSAQLTRLRYTRCRDDASLTANVSNRGLRENVFCLSRFACVYVNGTLHVDASLLWCASHFWCLACQPAEVLTSDFWFRLPPPPPSPQGQSCPCALLFCLIRPGRTTLSQLCKLGKARHHSSLKLSTFAGGRFFRRIVCSPFSASLFSFFFDPVWSPPYRLNIVNGERGAPKQSEVEGGGEHFCLTNCLFSILGISVFCLIRPDRPIPSQHCELWNGGASKQSEVKYFCGGTVFFDDLVFFRSRHLCFCLIMGEKGCGKAIWSYEILRGDICFWRFLSSERFFFWQHTDSKYARFSQ